MPEIINGIDGIDQKPGGKVDSSLEVGSAIGNPTAEKSPPEKHTVSSSNVLASLILFFAFLMFVAIWIDAQFIVRLSDSAYARGLITWLICVATMGMAFVLVYQAFATTNEDSYRRAREILTGLMGVMGTIIGFYFGAVTDVKQQLSVEPVMITAEGLLTTVSGGQAPYTYTVRFSQSNLPLISGEVAAAGQLKAPMSKVPTEGTIEIAVVDQKNEKAIAKTAIAIGSPGPPTGLIQSQDSPAANEDAVKPQKKDSVGSEIKP